MLSKFFDVTGRFCWEVQADDVNEYQEVLIDTGVSVRTRRGYINTISNFYAFLLSHPEIPMTPLERASGKIQQRIDWKYGVKLSQPVDKWFMPIHSSDDTTVRSALPSRDHLRTLFRFIRQTAERSVKPVIMHRDYAMFSLMYHTGIRQDECRMLDISDVNFEQGVIHVRFGKGSRGSGKRERWVPIVLHGVAEILKIYLTRVRPHFLNSDRSEALFLSERGSRISSATIKRRLQDLIDEANGHGVVVPRFTCHDLRRAFATHHFEDDPTKLEIIRRMLGHEHLATTQRYIRPSQKFLQDSLERWANARLSSLGVDSPDD
ncbi:tyrosine-type recombinase/integrase [Alicyclobacillus dauci]|uniref:Tyrosine-type recombinase/integrase n=1 Tax=Alicyclobacillus dauci TaxID=1475485 RepID=A0ABY6YX83_9BACL|nr:tyrosine-type recombinase/integrase [Alicyclobacillus dauci]WAH35194.1 tyrosine-type recombinase/integrase [Alicyclobacillus dauci]